MKKTLIFIIILIVSISCSNGEKTGPNYNNTHKSAYTAAPIDSHQEKKNNEWVKK